MENLIVLAGLLSLFRAYWVFNILNEQKGLTKITFIEFWTKKDIITYFIFIRPFFKQMKNEKVRFRVNITTLTIYICLSVGIYFSIKSR